MVQGISNLWIQPWRRVTAQWAYKINVYVRAVNPFGSASRSGSKQRQKTAPSPALYLVASLWGRGVGRGMFPLKPFLSLKVCKRLPPPPPSILKHLYGEEGWGVPLKPFLSLKVHKPTFTRPSWHVKSLKQLKTSQSLAWHIQWIFTEVNLCHALG